MRYSKFYGSFITDNADFIGLCLYPHKSYACPPLDSYFYNHCELFIKRLKFNIGAQIVPHMTPIIPGKNRFYFARKRYFYEAQ